MSRMGMLKAIGRQGKAKGGRQHDSEFQTPVFLSANNLNPFIPRELLENSVPVVFEKGAQRIIGYKAEFLPKVCEVFLDARDAGKLRPNQLHIAEACKILYRAFATVGIIALVDEVTGYQEVRDRLALQTILDKYLGESYAAWAKTFPDEFYHEIFRLKNWPGPDGVKRPAVIGHYTNDIVYDRLAPGVLRELRRRNPTIAPGRRKSTHHQWLTPDHGNPKLREHLIGIIALLRAAPNWVSFQRTLNRAYPKVGDTLPLPFDESSSV